MTNRILVCRYVSGLVGLFLLSFFASGKNGSSVWGDDQQAKKNFHANETIYVLIQPVRAYSKWTNDAIWAAILKANEIWKQAGIQFIPVGGDQHKIFSPQDSIFKIGNRQAIPVVFDQQALGGVGLGVAEGLKAIVAYESSGHPLCSLEAGYTTAHEIGHLLALEDDRPTPPGYNNLMSLGPYVYESDSKYCIPEEFYPFGILQPQQRCAARHSMASDQQEGGSCQRKDNCNAYDKDRPDGFCYSSRAPFGESLLWFYVGDLPKEYQAWVIPA